MVTMSQKSSVPQAAISLSQALMSDNPLKKTSKRRAWATADVRELKSLARKKTPAKKIARTLKRSEGATRQKAFSMGLSLDSRM